MKTRCSFALVLALLSAGCTPRAAFPLSTARSSADVALEQAEHRYVVGFLQRNPAVNTALGGGVLDASLAQVDGRLRDVSPEALTAEDAWLEETAQNLQSMKGATDPALLVDREVSLAQMRFLLHQHRVRRYQERSVDSYVDEPFRSIDWQLQEMSARLDGTAGSDEEWSRVASRLSDTSRYLQAARVQLLAGVRAGNTPDGRMLVRHGLKGSAADAAFFQGTFPALVKKQISGPNAAALGKGVCEASRSAAAAYREFGAFLAKTFFDDPSRGTAGLKPEFTKDRFALGEQEYDWALRNNLRVDTKAAQLYAESWPRVLQTQQARLALAREILARHHLSSANVDPVLRVREELGKSHPRSDGELLEGYHAAVLRLVAYARRTHLFDVPADYPLVVMETPLPLRATLSGAAYSPAPPFRSTGVGRFYVAPTGNNPVRLAQSNFASMPALAAHEGFPGHDWHYKLMTRFRGTIGWVRWLTPGGVEDSSSMWEDSMMAEGWGLYAEALVAEPRAEAPEGFYAPEERFYQLSAQLMRELRVRLDIGLHTGRLSYGGAVDLLAQVMGSVSGSCSGQEGQLKADQRQVCQRAETEIYRYSVSPTQAITYRLGKDQLISLRHESEVALGSRFSLERFHLDVMRQGTIPVPYFRDLLLRDQDPDSRLRNSSP